MELDALLRQQTGVIARRQALALGLTDNDIERLIRRRVWARIWDGVYVDHTGPLTEIQRDWAAVLTYPTAALAGRSTLRRAGIATGSDRGRPRRNEVEVIVPHGSTTRVLPHVRTRRSREFDRVVHPSRLPPTMRIEEAALDIAESSGEIDAVAILSDACRSRQTTAERLNTAAKRRSRLKQRAFLIGVLADAAEGTHSVLELRYLRQVERGHALPRADRQKSSMINHNTIYRDVKYPHHGLVVELDGRLGHDLAADRWTDLDRDLASAEAGLLTVRLGYGQVLAPCRTAAGIARVLAARGWTGTPNRCGPNCRLKD